MNVENTTTEHSSVFERSERLTLQKVEMFTFAEGDNDVTYLVHPD